MVRECFVKTCSNKQKTWSARMFHRLPLRDSSRLKLWLIAMGVDANTPVEKLKGKLICEDHFMPCDYYEKFEVATRTMRRFLTSTAVPSVGVLLSPEQIGVLKEQEYSPLTIPSPALTVHPPPVKVPKHKFPLANLQHSASASCTFVAQRQKSDGRLQKVSSKKENTPGPLSACSEVEEKSWHKAVKSLQSYPGTSIFNRSSEVLVNTQCLLELFQYCWLCQIECCITIEGHERLFSVTQDCESCGHHKEWWSHPTSEHADEQTAAYAHAEHAPGPANSKVATQSVSLDHASPAQKYEQMFIEKDGSYLSSAEEDAGVREDGEEEEEEEEGKKRSGKRKAKRQDSSDEWEPRGDETMASDSDVSMDEDLFSAVMEDGRGKVAVWCSVCGADATLPCCANRHKKAFGCTRCCDGVGVEVGAASFEKTVVRFDSFGDFQKHAEKEHGAKPFHKLCQDCGKYVAAESESAGKKGHKCQQKAKPILCPDCGKRFLTEVGLRRHYSKLHEDSDHPCKYCLKLFRNRPSKLEHEQTHPKEKQPYSCPDCPEKFENIYVRNGHLKIHRGPCKYVCDTCGKYFRDIIKLKRHKLVHSGEKPFKCQVCERSFNQMENLSSHMRLHTGEKPFMCEQCGECFNHNVSLKNHQQRHHHSGVTRKDSEK